MNNWNNRNPLRAISGVLNTVLTCLACATLGWMLYCLLFILTREVVT